MRKGGNPTAREDDMVLPWIAMVVDEDQYRLVRRREAENDGELARGR
jgi:hypothetical protein